MATYQDMVEKDIDLMYNIHDYCGKTSWLNDIMLRIVSSHPLKDITAILWLVCLISVIELGSSHFWVVVFNLVVCVALRRLIEAKRPVEFDPDLQPTTDTNSESYAFPSLESYMSVVIVGHIFVVTKILMVLPLGIAFILLIGFSRVYSKSRFPHQIVGSWILGVLGLILGFAFCKAVKLKEMTKFQHGAFLGLVLVGIVVHFAISMENNDSRLVGIKKEEFKRVILDILHGGSERGNETKEETSPDLDPVDFTNPSSSANVLYTPRSLATQAAQRRSMNNNAYGNKKTRLKYDSFYYLQKSLEERENRMKAPEEVLSSGNLRQRVSKYEKVPKYVLDEEDLAFHDSYSETSQGDARQSRKRY